MKIVRSPCPNAANPKKNRRQSCRDTASEIFCPSENCTLAVSLPEFMKNDPQSCRDTASEIF
ncbi:hypothetical protein, partial [Microseira wollei]|uniref:hypothetical protein n=1 Tax=Microseira wollei TaxID=467598 RepID=UPI001CFF1844